ncbi:MAG: glycosyltransferase WbuB [Desulfuromonadales bacterium C00003107]|jgi:glycosyltransferase involved in cell wall biosynthesis|nr:MAG: glycosyltransferase WbuB [Desulfuromonadales bacterium C00003107]
MEILYFHQYFSTPEGAGGLRSYEMAKALIQRGHKVTMVCSATSLGKTGLTGEFKKGRRAGYVDGIKVIELELPYSNYDSIYKRSITFLRFSLRSLKIALTEKYDLIFTTSTPLTVGLPGIAAAFFRRKPFVFEVRDLWPELPREMGVIKDPFVLKAMDILEWLSYHSARKCIGLSPGIVEGIKRRGIDAANVEMIPNGCDLDIFTPYDTEEYLPDNISENDFVAIFSGAHGLANGLTAVLDAAAILLKRQRTDIKIIFIGDGKLKPALKQRAEEEGLTNCLFMDPVPKRQLAALQRGAHVGLMALANVPAFYYGTSPNKFFDYIASGLPVLNNYPGWLAGMIDEHKCGLAVPPSDSQAFADALEYMAKHREELGEMGKNSRRLAEQEFSRSILADRFVKWLEGATVK